MGRQDKLVVEQKEMVEMDNTWVGKVLTIGAVVGALTGLGAAYLLVQRAKRKNETPNLNSSEGIKLGLLVFGLLRQVSMLGSGDEK